MTTAYPIFDGHNDLLARLWLSDHDNVSQAFWQSALSGQIDWQRCQQGQLMGGLFAIFVPPLSYIQQHAAHRCATVDLNDSRIYTRQVCLTQLSILQRLIADSAGQAKLCRSVADIMACQKHQQLAIVMHLEGAECMDDDFDFLHQLYVAGLRSIGPVWNLPSQFGYGLQAAFPHSPDTGAGLTALGQRFIATCSQLNLLVDVSHMNYRAFMQTAECLSQPIVATHSNAHALCPQARNLNDEQLTIIARSQGFVGVNLDTAFLRADGKRDPQTPLSTLLAHFDYLIEHVGEDHVGFGSDFDGGFMSHHWPDIAAFPMIIRAMQHHGYSPQRIEKICYKNWLAVLKRIWGE